MNLLSKYGDQLLEAFWTTIQLTFFSAIGAVIIGVLIAAMRVSPVPVARFLGAAYVTVFRNTPLTLILLFCLFGLSQTLGVNLAKSDSPTFLVDNNFRLAVLGSVSTPPRSCVSHFDRESIPFRSARPKRADHSVCRLHKIFG